MPASPILLLVPYRNKAAVLYSQIPTSALASGDMVVSRAGVSTRVNAQGNIESVAANVPRLNYPLGGVANGCPALLVEPTATNAFQKSEEFEDAYWVKTNVTVTTNATIAPDGTMTADKITATTTGTDRRIQRPDAIASGTYTTSIFIKAAEINTVRLFGPGFSSATRASFTLTGSGTVSNLAGATAQIQNYGNGWYKCSVSAFYGGGAATQRLYLNLELNGGSVNAGDGVFVWGAQSETGSVPTSYIPTTTGTVTRNADIVTNNTFVIPNLIGAILTEFDSPTSGTYFLDNIPIPIASGSNKIAISYTPTTLTIYRNGAQVSGSPVTPPGGTAPVIGNVINIGHNNQLYQLGSGIKSFVLYSSTLSAAEASGLTT